MIREIKIETLPEQLRGLPDTDLVFHLQLLVRGEHASTVRILHHLNELERRKLYLDLGYGSLFDYCTRKLGYSHSAAGRRIQAARCIRRFPKVLELLEARELTLSTISLIEPILKPDNADAVLERVRGASHRDVEKVVSEYRAPRAYRDRIQPVQVPAPVNADEVLFDRMCQQITFGAGSRTLTRSGRGTSPMTCAITSSPGMAGAVRLWRETGRSACRGGDYRSTTSGPTPPVETMIRRICGCCALLTIVVRPS